jgi:hypothetical protein
MRQILIGVFMHRACADAALRQLEMRGFASECLEASPQAVTPAPALTARGLWLRRIQRAVSPPAQAPREGEVHVKVHAASALEAQAARELLQACGARQARCLGAGWANWSW